MESYDPPGAGPAPAFPPDITAALGSSDATFTIVCDGNGLTKDRLAEWKQRDPEACAAYMRETMAEFRAIALQPMEDIRAMAAAIVRKPTEDLHRFLTGMIAHYEKAHAAPPREAPRVPQHTLGRRRERRSRAHAHRGPPGDDEGPEPSPRSGLSQPVADVEGPRRDSDLNLVWAEARGRFETAEEYRVLGELCRIRADWLEAA